MRGDETKKQESCGRSRVKVKHMRGTERIQEYYTFNDYNCQVNKSKNLTMRKDSVLGAIPV